MAFAKWARIASGATPMRVSGRAKKASDDATTISLQAMTAAPSPTQAPCAKLTTGTLACASLSTSCCTKLTSSRADLPAERTSAPAQKLLPAAAKHKTLIRGLLPQRSISSMRLLIIPAFITFETSGRLKVAITAPRLSIVAVIGPLLLIALPHGVTFGFLAAAHRVTHDDQRVQSRGSQPLLAGNQRIDVDGVDPWTDIGGQLPECDNRLNHRVDIRGACAAI